MKKPEERTAEAEQAVEAGVRNAVKLAELLDNGNLRVARADAAGRHDS